MMHSSLVRIALTTAIVASTFPRLVLSQTSSFCNPLTQGETLLPCLPLVSNPDRTLGGCLADTALGRSANFDFTTGASDSFTGVGSPTYTSQGAGFTVAKSGDSPQIVSKWYIMFGHVEFVIKAAPGTGIVSSAVLISDCLDEIDWEWIGGDDSKAQSNYFGKGMTTTYNRGASHPVTGTHDQFHKYTIDWTAEQIVWQIDGVTVRAMTVANAAQGQYPQTPMQIKVGTWSGGDPSNRPGTIDWAGGPTDYSAGPSTMYLQSMAVTDYSTGTSYSYSGTDGTWQSIKSNGGSIGEKSGSNTPAQTAAVSQVSSGSVNSAPIPFEGTHRDSTSTFVTPTGWPWVGTATATLQTAVSTGGASIAGLPSGWTVTSSGKVLPPSAGYVSPSSCLSPYLAQRLCRI